MNDRAFLSVFTPSRTKPEDLEAIFVQRQALLADAVARVQESATTGNKHHLLFVGPRGTGKTHFVTLLVHRLSQNTALQERLRIAWLNEDETNTTFLELLRRIYLSLVKRYPGDYSEAALEPLYDLDGDAATPWLKDLLLESLQGRTLLVVVENLDALFEGIGSTGQKQLRAFIQERPVFSIVATAQRLVDDIAKRTSVFFGFFQTESLQTLTVEEATALLGKIAKLNKQRDAAEFLQTSVGRSRIRALHHLSGGNHRVYIVLSQFITRESLDALVQPFAKMLDEMTPYYQERIRWLPPLQRKIVEHLCTRERPVPVKDLAKRLFSTPQTISSQLVELRSKGYVISAQRGRESLYEIAEPLMRLCVEVKENQTHEPMRILVDFLRVWYDEQVLSNRLQGCEEGSLARTYFQAALERNSKFGNLRKKLLVEDFRNEIGEEKAEYWLPRIESYTEESEELGLACGEWAKGNSEEALKILGEIVDENSGQPNFIRVSAYHLAAKIHYQKGALVLAIDALNSILSMEGLSIDQMADTLFKRGFTHGQQGETESEIADYSAVIGLANTTAEQIAWALNNRGYTYGQLGEFDKAIADYNAAIGLQDAPVEPIAWVLNNRGVTYGQLGETEKAIADYSDVISLSDAPVDQVAQALFNRGVTYGQLGETEKEIADYSAVIDLPYALFDHVAKALYNRGVTYGQLGETEKAIDDYSAVIVLPDAPVDQLAKALYNRGITYQEKRQFEQAEQDFNSVDQLAEASIEDKLDAQLALTEIRIATGRWETALATLAEGLTEAGNNEPPYFGDSTDIIHAFFESGLSPAVRQDRARELVKLYAEHKALIALGEALTRQVGKLNNTPENLPASDNLEQWATVWEAAGRGYEELRLPLRIFRTGMDYLKAGGKDRGILLDLNQEERRILQQVLGLDES